MKYRARSPERIAKYTIEHVLGSGAMGIVYKAHDEEIERPVAIKVLHDHLLNSDNGAELKTRFLQEAKAAARCLHPNIVTIFDYGSHQDAPYIAMEYVDGTELRGHIKNQTEIPLPSATDIAIQILEALSHAHDKGVIHRDIKPENVIILENGTVKVSDFGVARLDTSDLTGTGYMIGTPNYMSPEGLQGDTVDARSDLFSVGILFFELTCRKRYDRDLTLQQNLERLHESMHLSPQNIRSIRNILNIALRSDRKSRYANTALFIQDLKSIEDMDLTQATLTAFPRPESYTAETVVYSKSNWSSSNWNSDVLDSIERSLAKYVGPMAKLIIKKNIKTTTDLNQLITVLSEHIPNDTERSHFFRAASTSLNAMPLKSQSPPQSQPRTRSEGRAHKDKQAEYSVELLEALAEILKYYTGPIAKRMVNKLAKQNPDLDSLIECLGNEIPDLAERKEFYSKVRSHL